MGRIIPYMKFETTNQALMRGMHPYTHVTICPHLTHPTHNRHSTTKHVNDMDLKMIQHDLYAPCIVYLRPNTLICPRLSAAIFVCAEDVVKMGVFCIMANFMFYIGTHSIGTCASLLHHIIIIIIIITIIKPLLKIFNGCRSLTGLGELNPY